MSVIYSFGPFFLDVETMRLLRDSNDVGLRHQAAQALRMLLEHSGMVVSYEDLARFAWGDTDPVSHDRRKIHVTIHELKGSLGEYAVCIETIKKRGYRFNHPQLATGLGTSRPRSRSSLVLLPFTDLTQERDKSDLAVGMMHELATSLTKLDHLQVIKGLPHTIQFLPREQQGEIRYLLEGSFADQDRRLQIHIELRRQLDGALPWSETFRTTVSDLPGLQAQIAAQVAQAVKVKTNIEEIMRMSTPRTVNGEAYQFYLRGLHHWNRPTEVDLLRAVEYFRQATTRDPNYAEAFAGLSAAYNLLDLGGFLPARDAMPQSEVAASRCLEISPDSPEGLTSLAGVEVYFKWNWRRAEDLLQRAILVNPRYDTAHHLYAMGFLMPHGRFDEALREIRAAETLSPLSPFIVACVGIVLYYAGDYREALKQFDRALELQPHFHLAHWHRGWASAELGDFEVAINSTRIATEMSGAGSQLVPALAQVHAAAGQSREAKSILRRLGSGGSATGGHYASPYDLALVHVTLGDANRALHLLEHAVRDRVPALTRLGIHPAFRPLHGNKQFDAILTKVNLPRSARHSPKRSPTSPT